MNTIRSQVRRAALALAVTAAAAGAAAVHAQGSTADEIAKYRQ
ncbi:MAG: sulfur oxidation c-type cytochrome SoxA, partial [Cupriavidus sp.]|nr:sulfur oxidation c-type cytochrome SoxA [Cupriavidus sp.]